ncbi:MAG: nucleotide exchange factor GrpE [Clostridia bacterium]|nr:nucleotide exchange factor GrpE [Clostridia bacterium]
MAKKKTKEEAPEKVQEQAEAAAENDYDALNEKYLRVLAEYDNFRKRTVRERESIYPEAKAAVVKEFLPLLDNLERALAAANEGESLCEGVKMVLKQMKDILKNLGVEEIKTVGEEFNPNLHNAVMHVEDPSLGENVVAAEMQKGYTIGGRVIRFAMVSVAN